MTDDPDRRLQGMAIRRAVLGDAHVDRATARGASFDADFQDWITRNVWGDVWARPGLDQRTRSLLTLAMLLARGQDNEFVLHLAGARRNGVTDAEIKELILHAAVYCGVPAANHAANLAAKAMATRDGEA